MDTKVTINYMGPMPPEYASQEASGADLCAFIEVPTTIEPQKRALISTGLFLEIPIGYEAQVRPRSGLALKHGITVLNSPGTIDSDYRGEIKVVLINLGEDSFTINPGDRIAQLVIAPVIQAQFLVQTSLSQTLRNAGGFGSTGNK